MTARHLAALVLAITATATGACGTDDTVDSGPVISVVLVAPNQGDTCGNRDAFGEIPQRVAVRNADGDEILAVGQLRLITEPHRRGDCTLVLDNVDLAGAEFVTVEVDGHPLPTMSAEEAIGGELRINLTG